MSRRDARRPTNGRARFPWLLALSVVATLFASHVPHDSQVSARGDRAISVPILVYHRLSPLGPEATEDDREMTVEPGAFEAQMHWLSAEGFHTVSMARVADALDGGRRLPTKPVVVSFDDGYEDGFAVALPILRRYGLTATFYVHPQALGRPGRMTWEQVRALDRAGMEIGSHTLSHPHLPALDDHALSHEVLESRVELETFLGHRITSFAYPFGDHDDRVVEAVRAAGYRTAVTVRTGVVHRDDDRLLLDRIVITSDDGAETAVAWLDRR